MFMSARGDAGIFKCQDCKGDVGHIGSYIYAKQIKTALRILKNQARQLHGNNSVLNACLSCTVFFLVMSSR